MAPITVDELHLFHRMDREVFSCLVIKLTRDPAQSLLVMALWLWLENTGYTNIISKLVGLSDNLINALANEAVTCLKWLELENTCIPNAGCLPLTTILMQREISLQLLIHKRFTVIAGIKCILNKVCARIFIDILQNILDSTSTSTSQPSPYRPLLVPGFPHPLFGTFTVPPLIFDELDLSDMRIWDDKRPSYDVTDDDKTMFLTFSRGFPVTEEEVRHLFRSSYGDCIKVINMGNGDIVEQVMFATMVLKNVETIDQILNGKRIAKFRVNGKHIWARKYERRD
ncbi:uncharacterized protein LOC133287412 [Gastrolobium bilobum]|uniref:uncharacterized protein LOC133287412 n=1 Tax=Gastrolobium bilobum TaxID=150636 RepID=UPI002AAF173B|nr:uncharacterized protein LOC133287412 [Gastrolobium bilobum]